MEKASSPCANTFILDWTKMYANGWTMWSTIKKHFEGHAERLRIARVLIENGLNTKHKKIFLNQIEIPPVRIARVAGVDRRTVNETLNEIEANPELRMIFEEIRSAGYSLKEIANPRRIKYKTGDRGRSGAFARTKTHLNRGQKNPRRNHFCTAES